MGYHETYEAVLNILKQAQQQRVPKQDITIRLTPEKGLVKIFSGNQTFSEPVTGRLTKQQIDVLRQVGYPVVYRGYQNVL